MGKSNYEIVKVDAKEFLAMVDTLPFTKEQVNLLLKATPVKFIKEREIPGGFKAKYVSTQYIINALNLITGFKWDFDIIEDKVEYDQIVVKGKLTVHAKGNVEITKTQYGRSHIKFYSDKIKAANGQYMNRTDGKAGKPVDYGNDFKAAASDCLKKCASLLGIAWDVYGSEEMNEIQMVDKMVEEENKPPIAPPEIIDVEEAKAFVSSKFMTMATTDRIRLLKKYNKVSEKNLTDYDYTRLYSDLKDLEGSDVKHETT